MEHQRAQCVENDSLRNLAPLPKLSKASLSVCRFSRLDSISAAKQVSDRSSAITRSASIGSVFGRFLEIESVTPVPAKCLRRLSP